MRTAEISRQTNETQIRINLDLDGSGKHEIVTGIGFLDHMLTHLAVHGLFDLVVQAKGDLEIDTHHTVEDVSLALGQAFDKALGDRNGIVRMGDCFAPMDETLAHVAIDLSGRPYSVIQAEWHTPYVGNIPTTLFPHFFESFTVTARCNLHARVLYGRDDHHQAEALFKAWARALDAAIQIDPRRAGNPLYKGNPDKMNEVVLIDAGTGNLRSVQKALESLGANVQRTDHPQKVLSGKRVVLPGVGAFGDFMSGLRARGLDSVIKEVAARGVPLLGICVGMQAFFDVGEKMGRHNGLGLLPGQVARFEAIPGLKIPHTGWNQIEVKKESSLFHQVDAGAYAYFNHSYFCHPGDSSDVIARTDYGHSYACAVQRGNIYGVQFHPEKSQAVGLHILKNFLEVS